jgi:hypothetical protein
LKVGNTWKVYLYLESLAATEKAGSGWKDCFAWNGWLYPERLALPGKAGSTRKG